MKTVIYLLLSLFLNSHTQTELVFRKLNVVPQKFVNASRFFFPKINTYYVYLPLEAKKTNMELSDEKLDVATFGAGCFWCVEAIFQSINGVKKVISGYAGGITINPTYHDVCSGITGHAEVCQIYYDPEQVTYDKLLEAFWSSHDPTTLNRQGNNAGTQYRSIILYHNKNQQQKALNYLEKLNKYGVWDKPVVTEISLFTTFYKAELTHQNYYKNNKNQPYCSFVITPKLEKFKKNFKQ